MRPPKQLPKEPPFLSIYTVTYRRPEHLALCMRSVSRQTAVEHVEHLIVPDYPGYGVAGSLYARTKWYGPILRGKYVTMLCDDDTFANEQVVEKLMALSKKQKEPTVILGKVDKGGLEYPAYPEDAEPESGLCDLCSLVVERETWLRHLDDFGQRYEGDYDFTLALYKAGYRTVRTDFQTVIGGASNGRPEAVDW